MMLDKSIVIIGEICSGKSTLAKKLSNKLQIPRASFGSYLSHYCNQNNIPESLRKNLQDLGQNMIDNDPKKFLLNVIEHSVRDSKSIIFEGVRHHIILDNISTISRDCSIIFIDASHELRLQRFLNREKGIDKNNKIDFIEASSHPVEMQVKELKLRSDLVIQSSDSIETDFDILLNFINRL